MRCVAITAAQIGARFQHLVEGALRPREMDDELVRRKRMIDRIAQRGDDAAIRNVSLDACRRIRMKKVRTDFSDLPLAGRVAKMTRVPVDALVVEGVEELRLLDAVRQIDVTLEHAMQPGGAGAAGTSADNFWQPAGHGGTHPSATRGLRGSAERSARGIFQAERSMPSNSSSASTSGR